MEASTIMSHTISVTPPPTEGYQDVLGKSFHNSYQTADDVWTGEAAMRKVLPLLLERVGADSLLLDIGAGRGRDTQQMLAAGHRVDALDMVATEEWQAMVQQAAPRLQFMQGDLMALQLSRQYDGMLDNGCLHHQHPDAYAAYLKQLMQHCKPGGVLVVSFFTPSADAEAGTLWVQHDGRLTRDFTSAEAGALLQQQGWQVEACHLIPREVGSHHYLAVVCRRPQE